MRAEDDTSEDTMNAKNRREFPRRAASARPRSRRRGFTAAELAAVAAIIAILSLIIVPIFRDRVDEAKRVATLDDMQGLAKALLLVKADTGRYVRLNDLDNPSNIVNDPPLSAQEVPIATTAGQLDATSRFLFAENWQGPYVAFQNSIDFAVLSTTGDFLTNLGGNFGPIIIYDGTGAAGGPYDDITTGDRPDRYPTDHYGSPYIFRPPSSDLPPGGLSVYGITNETEFGNAFIYSMGPNSIPGDGGGNIGSADATQNPYYEESGILGNPNTDDLKYIF